jgi:glucose/arabinose dehydrogenase
MQWVKRATRTGMAGVSAVLSLTFSQPVSAQTPVATKGVTCAAGSGGLVLPPGFCATVFADKLGPARQIVMASHGTLYVNTVSDRDLGPHLPSPPGGFVVALRDTMGTGQADFVERFGVTSRQGGAGGSGIALHENAVYAEENGRILRYARIAGEAVPSQPPVVVVSGLPFTSEQPEHPFAIDGTGNLVVSAGSVAGVLAYDAAKDDQTFSPADPYAPSLRHAKGLAFAEGHLFAVQVGELVELRSDAHSPGPKEPGAAFPDQLTPTALAIYQGTNFPPEYRGGAFIAFQSASRQGAPSGGKYTVVFQPMANGRASGPAEVFAHGFTAYRPSGLAIGPDGALFVSDSVQGRIWRITYGGSSDSQAAPATSTTR